MYGMEWSLAGQVYLGLIPATYSFSPIEPKIITIVDRSKYESSKSACGIKSITSKKRLFFLDSSTFQGEVFKQMIPQTKPMPEDTMFANSF